MSILATEPDSTAFLENSGEMGQRVAAYDWTATALGPIATWSQSLRAIVAFLLHSPVPIVMLWGEEGTMIYNDGYSEFAGDNHPRILGLPVREAWPEVADFNDNVMKVGLAGGTLAYKDHLLRLNRTGMLADVWMNLDYSPVYGGDGTPAGVLAVVVETTEAVQNDTALRASEARLQQLNESLEAHANERAMALETSQTQFRLLVQGVTDYAIYMLDDDGVVTSWNAGAERIKGYHPDEIIGRNFSSFYEEQDRIAGEPARALDTARQTGRFAAEGWRIRKDGTRFRASVVIDAIADDHGNPIGFAKITRDVTEREEALHELELAREALFQSQKMEAIGQLTGGVAHDFNNLLMAIHSGLELLRKRAPRDPQTVRLLDNCLKAADRGAALTQRMLAFARRQELATESISLPQLVGSIMELLRRSLGPSFMIQTSFPADLAAVSADVNQLEMALLNLAVNARDAMPGGGTIAITALEREVAAGDVADLDLGRYVRLTVADSGSGMAPETLARAADPFFTTKGVGKGTGLGLSMVHGFARQIGGALELESRVGAGTHAHIWLPISGKDAGEGAVESEAAAAPGRTHVVLVVDDDAIILMNTAALLEDLGHRVIEASSGEEALDLLRARPDIDMLVTDQAMPGMTGSQLIAAVRDERPGMPIILATGYGETPSDANHAVVRLGKPFGQKDLERAVRATAG